MTVKFTFLRVNRPSWGICMLANEILVRFGRLAQLKIARPCLTAIFGAPTGIRITSRRSRILVRGLAPFTRTRTL